VKDLDLSATSTTFEFSLDRRGIVFTGHDEREEEEGRAGHELAEVVLHPGPVEERYGRLPPRFLVFLRGMCVCVSSNSSRFSRRVSFDLSGGFLIR